MKNLNIIRTYCSLFFLLLLCFSCSKEKLPKEPIIDLGGESWKKMEIDEYIYSQFVKPYNMEIKYKWNPYEVNFYRTLVPPIEGNVIPVLNTLTNLWLKPYEKTGGKNFFRRFPISKVVLVGSPEYQENGAMVVGTAQGGSKINLYDINNFSTKYKQLIVSLMGTVHHEYAHIFHQSIRYPEAWGKISAHLYTETWFNTTDEVAKTQGFVSAYAKSSDKEDFAETIAYLLVLGQETFDQMIRENIFAEKTFRAKEKIIVQYYKEVLNIDFRKLQAEVKSSMDKLVTN